MVCDDTVPDLEQVSSRVMDYYSAIVDTLESVESPGYYATGGEYPLPLPSLSLNAAPDVILGLPLSESQAKLIIDDAARAPLGRGEDITMDTSVFTWQLNPTEFTINNERWEKCLQILFSKVKADLGCNTIFCELYKLLLHEPGDFFKVSIIIVLNTLEPHIKI